MLGCAWQHGLVPVSHKALMRAIELNGVEIEKNLKAFEWGRIAAGHAADIETLIDGEDRMRPDEDLDFVIERRADFLVGYQDKALAERYVALVERVRAADARARWPSPPARRASPSRSRETSG